MYSHEQILDGFPKTVKVHEALGSEMWKRFGATAKPPRSDFDPLFTVKINDEWFIVDIAPERDGDASYNFAISRPMFPWNGRWSIRLDGGGRGNTFRPYAHQLASAAKRLADAIEGRVNRQSKFNGVSGIRLVVDNTK